MGKKDWRTPLPFFRAEWEKYRFNVDAAADDENALVRPYPYKALTAPPDGNWYGGVGLSADGPGFVIGRYYTKETNGLNPEHYVEGDRVWCNPPYDHTLLQWLALARETRLRGVFWEFLLQPATDTRWWHRYVWDKCLDRPREGVQVKFIEGRIRFIDPENPEKDSPPGANVIVRFIPEGFEL